MAGLFSNLRAEVKAGKVEVASTLRLGEIVGRKKNGAPKVKYATVATSDTKLIDVSTANKVIEFVKSKDTEIKESVSESVEVNGRKGTNKFFLSRDTVVKQVKAIDQMFTGEEETEVKPNAVPEADTKKTPADATVKA